MAEFTTEGGEVNRDELARIIAAERWGWGRDPGESDYRIADAVTTYFTTSSSALPDRSES
jgi:hypothetical protein